MKKILQFIIAASLAIGLQATLVCAEEAPKPPDLTAGGARDKTHDWLLGPTGLRGWMFTRKGRTTDARQILVTAVDNGSPVVRKRSALRCSAGVRAWAVRPY